MKANVLLAVPAAFLMTIAMNGAHAQSANAPADAAMQPTMQAAATPDSMSPKQADRALSRSVRKALSKAPGFDVSGVFVRARGGNVTLSGTVRNGDQIRQAEDIARGVQGVNSVSNKLTLFHGGNG
jgi:hyperosmotically inducible periplasmic protein